MKIKDKILTAIAIITLIVITLTATGVMAADISELKEGEGKSKIGQVFNLSYTNNLKNGTDTYCIQKGKDFNKPKDYTVANYVEINGNQAIVYNSKDSEGNKVVNTLNGQVAYILNQKQGYGTHKDPTDAQEALWYIANDWTTTVFGNSDYTWAGNTEANRNHINDEAEEYANKIGDQLATTENSTTDTIKPIVDKTNKDELTVTRVDGGYDRVGPFRWEFGGTLESITVKGDNKDVSTSRVRFVKYSGTTANIVRESDISTGEAFYVDISSSAGVEKLTGLELKTSLAASTGDIYTAKIWFLTADESQNLIYVDVGSSEGKPSEGTGIGTYDVSLSIRLGLKKVDDRDTSKPLTGVGFTFTATIQTYDLISQTTHTKDCVHKDEQKSYTDEDGVEHIVYQHDYDVDWVENNYAWKDHTMYLGDGNIWSETAKTYYTDDAGVISIKNIKYPTKTITNESYDGQSYTSTARLKSGTSVTATEVSNPYYGYTTGNTYTMTLNSGNQLANKTVTNHQKLVKLSGYVWIDTNSGKLTMRQEEHEYGENGFNDITVYLRDRNGNAVKTTKTSELGLYSEIDGGEYQFVDVDLDALQRGEYYVEFEYCGIDYQSVLPILDKNNGSKAIDTATRNVLDNKFTSVDSSGNQSLHINDVTVNYNDVSEHVSTVNNHTGCNVYARTNEAGYDLYSGFTPTSEEIRYVNLGLYKKPQTDYALAQDLHDVNVGVNGKAHIYKYAKTRFSNDGNDINEDETTWNVGVKFQKNSGTYDRAIYHSDAWYEDTENRSNEIKVRVTYKIALKNESSYLGRINSIVDYCDNRYTLIKAGTSIDDNYNVSGDIGIGTRTEYNNEYAKYIIDVNSIVQPSQTNYIYLQFEVNRDGVLSIINNRDLFNNVAEINSYTTFKDNNVNTPVAVIDKDSVIGNTIPGQINTYEDDTDAARSLKLELKNARALAGTVFEDATGKDNNVYTGQERKGNGIFNENDGDKRLSGIKVTLKDKDGNDVLLYNETQGTWNKAEVTTSENGDFEFVGYIPGNYIVTYTWGDETYKVQYYKQTIYDEDRSNNREGTKKDTFWYRGSEYQNDTISANNRYIDAFDDYNTRNAIDNEMENVKTNILESEINKAYNGTGSSLITQTSMNSSTPEMEFSVEYETTITDGTVDQVRFAINNVDFGIVERPKQQLQFSKRVSGFKITLANGQILVDAEITEDGQLRGSHDHTTYIGPSNTNEIDVNGIIRTEMDNELIEGATLEITYTMKVTNIGEADYVSDRYYYYGNNSGSDKVRVSVTELLDYVDGRLSVLDDKWEEKDINFLNDVNARQKDNEVYLNSTRTYLTTHLSKELAPVESNTVTLHTSKLLTSTDDNTFDNQSEIVEVTKTDGFNTGTPVKVVWNQDQFYFNVDNAETAIIIPSTGEDKSYVTPIIIGITTLLVLGAGIFVIKKVVIDNK